MSHDGRSRTDHLTAAERRELLKRLLRERAASGPLSFPQERLWFLHQLLPDSPVYNVPAVFRLRGDLDHDSLETAVATVVSRHAVLRSRFERTAEGPRCRIEDDVRIPVRVESVDSDSDEGFEAALARANREVRRPFDLERPPLARMLLLELGAADHLLVMTFHHIVAEGWSIAIFCRELATAYAAHRSGREDDLPALPMQYTDYARWQRRRAREPELEAEVDYWRQQLTGELPVLELPADRTRPSVQTFSGAWASLRLGAESAEAAARLARSFSTTPFTVHLAVFDTLLHRYTGNRDLLVGCPVAGRNRAEAEQLVGPFINTLVLRADLTGDPTFTELVEAARRTTVAAFSHQELPFERIIERIQPQRQLSHTPVFQVMFAMQNTPRPELHLDGLEPAEVLGPDRIHNGTTKVDLALFVEPARDGLEIGCEYSREIFEPDTIERFLRHYVTLLDSALADPSRRLSQLALLTESERERELFAWNRTGFEVPARGVVGQFREQAARRGEAPAVSGPDGQWTYSELDRDSNRLARHLIDLGVGAESTVALLAEPSGAVVMAMLAVAKAGGAYLPLEPTHPTARLEMLLEDAGAEVLLAEEALAGGLSAGATRVVLLDRDRGPWFDADPEALEGEPADDQLAYVIYTSGSTGRPKGVEIEHRGLSNLAAWHRAAYDVTPADRATQLAGLAFDASVWEVWPYLTAGASIHVIDRALRLSPDDLIAHLVAERITLAFAPTPLGEALLDRKWPSDTSLRALLVGGSALRRWAPEDLPFRLFNHYGPTENSVVSTACEVGTEPRDHLPPIGLPIGNHRVYLLDSRLEPVPLGVPGQIHVAGPGLARGYLHRPAATAAAFLPDPFAADGGRLYATGDIARRRSDGNLEFLGRRDDQIKLRGHRIELGEIEARLRQLDGVDEVAVRLERPGGSDAYLAAFYTASSRRVDAEILRQWSRGALPDSMVPARYVRLDALPLNASGKIDRDALPDPERETPARGAAGAGRLEGLAGEVAAIWRDILPASTIGVEDSFFDLGGNSLMLLEVHNRLRRELGSDLSMVDMFRHPTIASLVDRLESGIRGAAGGEERS